MFSTVQFVFPRKIDETYSKQCKENKLYYGERENRIFALNRYVYLILQYHRMNNLVLNNSIFPFVRYLFLSELI